MGQPEYSASSSLLTLGPVGMVRRRYERNEDRVTDLVDDVFDVHSPERVHNRGQSGFTLIEVLLAIAISGILVGAVSGAMLTLTRVTIQTSKHQTVTAAMTSFSESIKGLDYVNCGEPGAGYDYANSPDALDPTSLSVDSIRVIGVDYWVNDVGDDTGEGEFVSAEASGCSAGAPVVLAEVDLPGPPAPGPPATPSPAAAEPTPDQGAQLFIVEVRLDDVVQRSTVAKRRP